MISFSHEQKFRWFSFFWGLFFGVNDSFNNVKKVSQESFALLLASGIDEFNNTTATMNTHLKVIYELLTVKAMLFVQVYKVRWLLSKAKNFVFEKNIFSYQLKGALI
jgi:hypothetical protein